MTVVQARHCSCGVELWQWCYTTAVGKATAIWCASLADLVSYQRGNAPRHDVYTLPGRQVQRGACAPAPAAPEVA